MLNRVMNVNFNFIEIFFKIDYKFQITEIAKKITKTLPVFDFPRKEQKFRRNSLVTGEA